MKNILMTFCVITATLLAMAAWPAFTAADSLEVTVDPSTVTYVLGSDSGATMLEIENVQGPNDLLVASTAQGVSAADIRAWYATLMLAEARGKSVHILYYGVAGYPLTQIYGVYSPK